MTYNILIPQNNLATSKSMKLITSPKLTSLRNVVEQFVKKDVEQQL